MDFLHFDNITFSVVFMVGLVIMFIVAFFMRKATRWVKAVVLMAMAIALLAILCSPLVATALQ